jgi:hypothetical protein
MTGFERGWGWRKGEGMWLMFWWRKYGLKGGQGWEAEVGDLRGQSPKSSKWSDLRGLRTSKRKEEEPCRKWFGIRVCEQV